MSRNVGTELTICAAKNKLFPHSLKNFGYTSKRSFQSLVLQYHIPRERGIFAENTGLFISPSGISELDCATTKTDTEERSISIGRESLQVYVLPAIPGSRDLLPSEDS